MRFFGDIVVNGIDDALCVRPDLTLVPADVAPAVFAPVEDRRTLVFDATY